MPEDEAAAAAVQPAQMTPCAACRTLRRRCVPDCVFAPYFPAEDDESRFAAVHRVFGASNVTRLLRDVPLPDDRRRAAETLVEEAQARVRDPAFGCVSLHGILLALNEDARAQVRAMREEIAREVGAAAAAETVDVAAAAPEEKMEARAMVEGAMADARKQDAELLAQRRAFDLEWLQQQRHAAAAKRAGVGRRVHCGRGKKKLDGTKQMNTAAAAGESSSEKNVAAKPGIPEEHVQRQLHKQPAAAADADDEEAAAVLAWSEKTTAADSATTQLGGAGTSSVLDVAAAEELAKKLDAMIQRSTAARQHDDPAVARCASLGLHVTPRLQQPPQPRAMAQQIAEAAAGEQGMLIQLLAKQYDVNDTELDVALGHGHPDMHPQATEAQLVAAAFAAGDVFGDQGLAMPKMVQAQQLGAREHELIIHNVAAAELAREQKLAMIVQQDKQREEEIRLLLETAAALQRPQYSDAELDISPGHHRPTVYQMLQGQQLAEADVVQDAREPNTTTMQQQGAEHGCAAASFQPPGSAVG